MAVDVSKDGMQISITLDSSNPVANILQRLQATATPTPPPLEQYGCGHRRKNFIATACQFCGHTKDLRVCSNCKAIAYCSVDHQRADWARHKTVCKTFQSVLELPIHDDTDGNDSNSHNAWWRNRQATLKAARVLHSMICGSPLSGIEREMVLFARHCQICHSTSREDLFACSGCSMVSYCSADHQAEDLPKHTRQCPRFLFALRCLQAARRYDLPPVWVSPLVSQRYQPLPFDWAAYFNLRGMPTFPGPETAMIADVLSHPLTLLYAMERMLFAEDGLLKPLNQMTELTIHILFCERDQELLALTKYEELLHYLPQLQTLTVVLVGPNMDCHADMVATEEIACDDCLTRGRRLNFAMYPNSYSEFLQDWSDDYPGSKHPSVCAVFNSKLFLKPDQGEDGEFDTNSKEPEATLDLLLDLGIPTILSNRHATAAVQDLLKLDFKLARIVLPKQPNPYAGLVPHRVADPSKAHGEQLDYCNQYITAIAGRQHKLAKEHKPKSGELAQQEPQQEPSAT